MFNVEPDKKKAILQALIDHNGSYEKAGKATNTSQRLVQWVDVTENRKFNYTPIGRGRPELQKFIVGVRDLSEFEGWNNEDPKIKKARDDYDAGTHEMCSTRDGMNLLLYSIPRKIKAERKPYFQTNVVELHAAR